MIDYHRHANAEHILQDSWELFQRKGYLGVSIDEICLSCGITKPTLYYYFKNKENLFVEVLLMRLQGFRREIEQDGGLEEKLVRITLVILDSFQSDYSLLVRDLEHIKTPENASKIRDAFSDELFLPITSIMLKAVESGLVQGDAKFLAHLFMGIVESYIARANEYNLDNASLAKKLVSFFLKGAKL